ncbi:MAG: type I glyceraldehyde-3-phosphate dehydrogenase [Gammaproteobacteria bacterium]|nr:type I glyceraldehyde-3-phosphate dehydrogenase [Gammaproteobacteria bacterium]MBT5644708.1 type I glyceraldehyde-3-phosphate dehydrogenase [Gammaproteobacteria bacterium]MBT5863291.1 type I glyceraldehyde-3-phosphate dehydrogenase [Gammaproteobacteria bacterium]MBT7236975.1 type I glyceraldehyde-3-phosphate dehydrogenase [Gammaproteobacteria bacterium]|tara:strand:- start:6442 stop:7452 length:1011 start_codon:yes stop_codon:yes gene_type:complete
MTINVAINGFGRIGRNVFRANYESGNNSEIKIVAINDLGDTKINAHLLKYDTAHGPFGKSVQIKDNKIIIDDKDEVLVLSERDPSKLPWKDLNIDVVMECTGFFASKEKSISHIDAGAKKVLISAPAANVDATIVYGVNHEILNDSHKIVSNASCTTNCLAPLIKNIHTELTVESGIMTTIHSYTNDQVLTDVYHTDLRRARSATQSMIPAKTGAASAVGLVLPELNGKLDGFAIRVPTINVSLVDLCINVKRESSLDEINSIIKKASENELSGILGYNSEPLVSIDFNHSSYSSVYDESLSRVMNNKFFKICSWYDNEWGFSNRMLDVAKILANN